MKKLIVRQIDVPVEGSDGTKATQAYIVKEVQNSIKFNVGEQVSKSRLEVYCSDINWQVTIR